MKPAIPLVLSLAFGLSACAVGPDFKTPDAPATKTYISEQEILTQDQRVQLGQQIAVEWWTLFGSHELDGLIRRAIAENHGMSAARETLAQAQAAVSAERGSLLPQASLDALAGRQKYGVALFGPSNFFIPPFTYYEAGPAFSWTIDLFGGGQRRVERQQALTDYQQQELGALYVALTGNVVSQSIELAAVQSQIDAAQEVVRTDEKLLAMTRAAQDAGAATRMDVLNAQSRLAADRAKLPELKQRYSQSTHMLAVLVGQSPGDWTAPHLNLNQLRVPSSLPVSLPSELVHKRPDILAAEANLHAASATIGIATANQYPTLTLSADMFQEALTPSRLFYGASNAWALAGGLSVPVFNGGTLSAQKKEAEHAYQAALSQYQQTVVRAFGQVADALTALSHDDEALKAMNESESVAQAALDVARKRQEAGSSGLLDIELARRSYALARLQRLEAQTRQLLDVTQLFVALGGSPTDKHRVSASSP
ncbi:MAG: efflux transporter outer membrane subunit [Betaproteobacteria bacterium]|nr:efflux transporter outer membrane subunit [Betaproteobacteria bacterium]MDE2621929.1 efflux transporter outer membrane subunit [Betaproteobacteria bacterium]